MKNIKKFRKEVIINQIIRDLINMMVNDVIDVAKKNLKKIEPNSVKDIYQNNSLVVDFSSEMKKTDIQIKDFLHREMYNHKNVITNTNKGKKIINDLFNHLSKNPKKYINANLFLKDKKERVIADFIAGMTDRYAINLHRTIK